MKIESRHKIVVSEPWDFELPNGANIILATGISVIPGPDEKNHSKEYFLLNVDKPFEMNGEIVKQILCAPRHQNSNMEDLITENCTVGVERVKPEYTLSANSKYNINEVVYFAIGTIYKRSPVKKIT